MKKRRIQAFSGIEAAMILFSAYIIFSMILAGTIFSKEKGLTINVFLAAYGIPFSIFFLSKNIIDDEDKIKKFFIFLSLIGLYLGLTGIFEYFQLKQLIFPKEIAAEWIGGFFGRARGPFLQPAVNGTVIGMIIFTTFLLFSTESKKWKKRFYGISLVCLNAALVFTLTRSAWVGFLVAILIVPIFIPRLRRAFFASLLILIILSFVLVYSKITIRSFETETALFAKKSTLIEKIVHRTTAEGSVTGRMDLYKIAFVMFLDSPFLGHGYGTFGGSEAFKMSKKSIGGDAISAFLHDTLIGLLIDLGLVGISIYFFIIFYIFNICRKLYNKLPRGGFLGKDLVVMCAGTFIVFLVSAQFFDIRFFLFPNSLLFCIAGILAGLYHKISRSENKSSGRLTV